MLPFAVDLRAGESPSKQVVYAATKAIVSGELLPGSVFPSVRVISQSLKINPNTAHKVVAELVSSGLLEVMPGVGTVVADWGPAGPDERRRLLSKELEELLVAARRLGLTRREVQDAVDGQWRALFGGSDLDRVSGEASHGGEPDENPADPVPSKRESA